MRMFDEDKMSSTLRTLRMGLGLSYKELERDFRRMYDYRVSWQSFRRWEVEPETCSGIRIETVMLLADYYGMTIDELVRCAE